MKKQHLVTTLLIVLVMASCKNPNGRFYEKRKDRTHIKNEDIRQEKREVLKTMKEINKWYEELNKELSYVPQRDTPSFTMKNYWKVPDSERFQYIRDTIIPGVKNCGYLTKGYKKVISKRHERFEDPGNLAYLMMEDELALKMWKLILPEKWKWRFLLYMGRKREMYSDNPRYERPEVSRKEADSCYMEMITIEKNNGIFVKKGATLAMDWGIAHSNPSKLYDDYLVFSLVKNLKGEWLLSNAQILDEGELIEYY